MKRVPFLNFINIISILYHAMPKRYALIAALTPTTHYYNGERTRIYFFPFRSILMLRRCSAANLSVSFVGIPEELLDIWLRAVRN